MLCVWCVLLTSIVVGQHMTANSFEHGHWTPNGNTPATQAEKLWSRLPLVLIAAISVVFLILARWLIPEKDMRFVIRVWGGVATFVGLVASLAISAFFTIIFYMD